LAALGSLARGLRSSARARPDTTHKNKSEDAKYLAEKEFLNVVPPKQKWDKIRLANEING